MSCPMKMMKRINIESNRIVPIRNSNLSKVKLISTKFSKTTSQHRISLEIPSNGW